jgi:hypothetical protein
MEGKADLPLIDGIVIFKGTLKDTDHEEYQQTVKDW